MLLTLSALIVGAMPMLFQSTGPTQAATVASPSTRTLTSRDSTRALRFARKAQAEFETLRRRLLPYQPLVGGDCDATVGRYLPDYPNAEMARKVTVRHLLSHTGGAGDIFGPEFTARRTSLKTHTDYLQLYGARALEFEPGTKAVYSNYGMVLLGALIEKVSGTSYYDYVREHIFRPTGMEDTDSLPEDQDVPNRATGYTWEGNGWSPNTHTLPYRGTAAGGGYSTVRDLLRFSDALQTGALLPKALFLEATAPQNPEGWYGFGFGVRGEGVLRSYGHRGGAPGMNADFRVYPELGVVVVGLSNLDVPTATRIVEFYALRMPLTQ